MSILLSRDSKRLGALDRRIQDEPRISASQRDALSKIAKRDPTAVLRGFDQHMRPVVVCQTSGDSGRTMYALLRNGDPAKAQMPLFEEWHDQER